MAQEQDVFISGISGSIAQWSTEATAGRISATLSKIAGQNSQLINLLNHVAAGTKMSTKEMNEMGNEVRSSNKAAQAGQKTERIEAAKQGQFWKGLMSKVGMGDDRIVQQLIVNHRATVNASKQIESLVKSGFTRPEATSLVEESNGFRGGKDSGEFVKSIRKNFTKIGASIYALVTGIEEATKTGFMERFDMASELRQSGLTAGFTDINQGFIQLSKIISETGFTFGEAAEFTKNFSKTVGVNGVQSTLKFVKSMAHTGDAGGLMNKFSLHFGQVINMSGQYLEGLRISGQLQGRSEQQLRKGMDSFMSNVQATSNVLKVSMEEAAEIMKNSLGEADRGRLLTLPQEMQDSIRAGLQFAGGGEGPIMDLLAARLGAGSDQGFMLTSEFKQMSGSMIGQELIKYVQQVAPTLENQGDQAFQSQLANTLPQEVQRIIEMMGQQGTRGLILADDGMATILAQINQMAQNMKDAAKGISGGGQEDTAAMSWTEQQRQATTLAERSMTTVMPGFVKNVELLTETNRLFAEQAAKTLTYNTQFLDSINNAATSIDRSLTWSARMALLAPAEWGTFDNTPVQNYNQMTNIGTADFNNTLTSQTELGIAQTLGDSIDLKGFEKTLLKMNKEQIQLLIDATQSRIDDKEQGWYDTIMEYISSGGDDVKNAQNKKLIDALESQIAVMKRIAEGMEAN
jgi:hypothetical protein